MHSEIVSKKFVTSASGMNRRKRAFTTLIVSFFIVLCMSSYDILLIIPEIAYISLISLALMLLLFLILTVKLLNKQKFLVINISGEILKRQFDGDLDCYDLKDVNSIRIKRTVKNNIREILIGFSQGKRVAVNGLDMMELFGNELRVNSPKYATVKNVKEFIDYDHPLFYVVLGIFIGGAIALLLRFMKDISAEGLLFFDLFVALLTFFTGVVFIFVKPITSRYGNTKIKSDYSWGILMILTSVYFVGRKFL